MKFTKEKIKKSCTQNLSLYLFLCCAGLIANMSKLLSACGRLNEFERMAEVNLKFYLRSWNWMFIMVTRLAEELFELGFGVCARSFRYRITIIPAARAIALSSQTSLQENYLSVLNKFYIQ